MNSSVPPLGFATVIPPVISVATQIFPFCSTANESNLLNPPSQVINFPPLIDSGNPNLSTRPSPVIGKAYNRAPSVSATYKVFSSGDNPIPLGVVIGCMTSQIFVPSALAQ